MGNLATLFRLREILVKGQIALSFSACCFSEEYIALMSLYFVKKEKSQQFHVFKTPISVLEWMDLLGGTGLDWVSTWVVKSLSISWF